MAETVASVMPTPAEIAACKWLPDNELEALHDRHVSDYREFSRAPSASEDRPARRTG
jgi:hypothetical protein